MDDPIAKSLDNSLWSLSRSRSPKLWNVSEYIQPKQERSQKIQTPCTSGTYCYGFLPCDDCHVMV